MLKKFIGIGGLALAHFLAVVGYVILSFERAPALANSASEKLIESVGWVLLSPGMPILTGLESIGSGVMPRWFTSGIMLVNSILWGLGLYYLFGHIWRRARALRP